MDRHRAAAAFASLVVFAGSGGGSVVARAQSRAAGGEPVRVDYEGPADCPRAATFIERLTTRSPGLRATGDLDTTTRLVVRIARGRRIPYTRGDLTVLYPDGSEAKRTVEGDSCESVVDALALMSAMALDPAGASRSGLAGPQAEPPRAPEPPRQDVPGPADLAAEGYLSVGAGGGAVFGTAPAIAPEGSGFVEVGRVTGRLWAPSLRASFDYASSGTAAVHGGAMGVVRSTGAIDGCPLAWRSGPLRLVPCLRVEAGALAATGAEVTPVRSATRPWLAAGAAGRAHYEPTRSLFVELTAGIEVPFVRDTFYFEPATTIFRPPP